MRLRRSANSRAAHPLVVFLVVFLTTYCYFLFGKVGRGRPFPL